jgi:HlyD family secretion protein
MKMMIPLVAVLGLSFAWMNAQIMQPEPLERKPTWLPNQASRDVPRIVGVGIVEPPGEMIAIGAPHAGIVADVSIQVGGRLEAGDVMFRLEDAELRAQWLAKQSELAVAQAKLDQLQNLPRPESIRVSQQRLASAQAALMGCEDRLNRAQQLSGDNAVSQEELFMRRSEHAKAVADGSTADAELALLKAGSSKEEIEVARAEVASAVAVCKGVEIQLDKMLIRAPYDGFVIRLNVRKGEAIDTGRLEDPLIQFGRSGPLHVRAEFDESCASMISTTIPSDAMNVEGWTRGRNATSYKLKLDHWEPLVRPKKSLTGNASERVDTRVLVGVFEVVSVEPSRSVTESRTDDEARTSAIVNIGNTTNANLTYGQQLDIFVSFAEN